MVWTLEEDEAVVKRDLRCSREEKALALAVGEWMYKLLKGMVRLADGEAAREAANKIAAGGGDGGRSKCKSAMLHRRRAVGLVGEVSVRARCSAGAGRWSWWEE